MENPQSFRSRLLGGLAGLLVAFSLYLLSIGPVGYVAIRTGIEPNSVRDIYAPAGWLMENTALRRPMERYTMWWSSRGFVHRNRARTRHENETRRLEATPLPAIRTVPN